MMKNSALLMVIFAMLVFCPLGRAQDQRPTIDSAIAVARANMKADRTAIITTGMSFNDKDGAAFWPIYRQYEYERSKLDDRRAAVIKQYAQKYPKLTDADAKAMAEQMLECDSRLADVEEEVLQEVQQSASGAYGGEVLPIGPSRRLDDGYAGRSPHFLRSPRHNTPCREVAWQSRLSNEARCSSIAILIQEHSMFGIMKRHVIVGAMLMSAVMALSQTQVERETLSVQGYQGQATVIRNHGRVFVDVQDLARLTKGSLSFEGDRIILTLAPSDASDPAATPP